MEKNLNWRLNGHFVIATSTGEEELNTGNPKQQPLTYKGGKDGQSLQSSGQLVVRA